MGPWGVPFGHSRYGAQLSGPFIWDVLASGLGAGQVRGQWRDEAGAERPC